MQFQRIIYLPRVPLLILIAQLSNNGEGHSRLDCLFNRDSAFHSAGNPCSLSAAIYVTSPITIRHSISYWLYIGTDPVSLTVFEIMGTEHYGVTTLTLQVHMTSSIA